jgi:hypothetical protein
MEQSRGHSQRERIKPAVNLYWILSTTVDVDKTGNVLSVLEHLGLFQDH